MTYVCYLPGLVVSIEYGVHIISGNISLIPVDDMLVLLKDPNLHSLDWN